MEQGPDSPTQGPSTLPPVPRRTLLDAARTLVRRAWGPPAVYLGAALLARIGSFILIPVYTRKLTLEQYGDYALAQSILMLIQTLLSAGFLSAISRFYFEGSDRAAGRARAGAVAKWTVWITLAATAVLTGIALVAGRPGPGLFGRWELTCVVLGGAGAALASLPYLVMRLAQRPVAASIFNLTQFLATAGSGILLVAVLGRGLRGSIEAMGLSLALNGAAAVVFVLIHFRGVPAPVATLREALRFTLPLFPDALVTYVKAVTDRWVLKAAGLDAAVGAYALANQIMTPAMLVINAWNDAEGVRVGEIYREGGVRGVIQAQRSILAGYVAAAALPVIAIVAATPVLGFFVGKDYVSIFWLLPLVGLSLLVETLYTPSLYVVYYASRTRLISIVSVLSGVLHLALNFLLIPFFGIMGAIAARLGVAGGRGGAMWLAARSCYRDALAGSDGRKDPPPEPIPPAATLP